MPISPETTGGTMKARDLIGRRVTLAVRGVPCAVSMGGCEPLTATTAGVIRSMAAMPCGPIGVLEADDGRRIAFDAGYDLKTGKVTIEVPADG